MAYLGVSEAVRARLEGKPFEYVPPLNAVPQREHTPNPPTSKAEIPFVLSDTTFLVDVIEEGPDWVERSRAYPSLSFNIIDVQPRYGDSLVSSPAYAVHDHFTPVSTTEEVVKDGKQTLRSGARMLRQQAVEHPFNFMIEIGAYAKSEQEAIALISYVYDKFKPRGFIRVPRLDGTWDSWDMIFREYSDRDAANGRRAIGYEKEYKKIWTYIIEGYLDTSRQVTLVNTNRYRGLSIGMKE